MHNMHKMSIVHGDAWKASKSPTAWRLPGSLVRDTAWAKVLKILVWPRFYICRVVRELSSYGKCAANFHFTGLGNFCQTVSNCVLLFQFDDFDPWPPSWPLTSIWCSSCHFFGQNKAFLLLANEQSHFIKQRLLSYILYYIFLYELMMPALCGRSSPIFSKLLLSYSPV